MKDILLCDLDSTLADTRHRHHLAPDDRLNGDWTAFALACFDDTPLLGTQRLLQITDLPVHFVTGRSEVARRLTVAWLREVAQVPCGSLRLLRTTDPRDNASYKLQHALALRDEGLNTILMIDDWPPVASAMENVGIPTLCVNPRYDDEPMRAYSAGVTGSAEDPLTL